MSLINICHVYVLCDVHAYNITRYRKGTKCGAGIATGDTFPEGITN